MELDLMNKINKKINDLQSEFLEKICQQQSPSSVFLKSGVCLKGIIDRFDEQVILLTGVDKTTAQIVYKHAIATIMAS